MLAGGAPRIILLSLDRQTPFSPQAIHPSRWHLSHGFSLAFLAKLWRLTDLLFLPPHPQPAPLVQLLLAEDQSKVTRNGCGFEDLLLPCSDLLPGTCHVLSPPMVQQPVFSRTVCSNTASCSWGVALEKTCGFSPLPLQLSPGKDAACSAGTS